MKYPLGIQTFSEIRDEGYIYVDKTQFVYDLIASGKHYFLSRPRRFGKSLLISTLESVFLGQQALFDGLAIAASDYDFATYPVIKLEFAKDEFATADNLRECIYYAVDRIANDNGIELTTNTYNQRFEELVIKLHKQTGSKVVLLIDEYDKPILNNLNTSVLSEIKKVISAFFAVAKSVDEHLKFVFITGVSKFAKVSVFSGMNTLTDISMNKRFAAICGVTSKELEANFTGAINELAISEQLDRPKLLAKIKHWYNGYKFHQQSSGVYNPYSLLRLFFELEFKNYWYTTATPAFLLDLLQQRQYDLSDLTEHEVAVEAFDATEPEHIDVQSVFLQTGYLTIKEYHAPFFQLGFPNYEVESSFYSSVAARYGGIGLGQGSSFAMKLVQSLNKQDFSQFFETLSVFFANIPNNITIDNEKYYQSLFFAVIKLLGLNADVEVNTNIGRMDCVIETKDMVCIIEFKLDGTKEQALAQIIDKNYAQKYQLSEKDVVLIGVEFDKVGRNIAGWLSEPQ